MVDHTVATITRNGHVMPPGRTSVSRLGQTQSVTRGGTQDVGGMLVGDDNRLYGAAYPGSPLEVSRIRPHSATPAFRPLSASPSAHHIPLPSHLANNNNGPLSHRATYQGSQLQRANSTPRDRGMPPSGGGGGGAGGAAAARSVSVSRGAGGGAGAAATTATVTPAAAAPPLSSRAAPIRSAAQQRMASSVGMSVLDRSLPAVRAAAALEEELAAARVKLSEARDEARKAVGAVRRLEIELQEERAARVRLEDQMAAATRGRTAATASAAWTEPISPGARPLGERKVYTGARLSSVANSAAAAAAAAADNGEVDGEAGGVPGGGGGGSPRARPASASAASSHLVSSLRWEIRQLTATRDALAAQLADVKSSSRAQKLQEMQSEVERYREEVARQVGLVRLLSTRLDAAEAEAAENRLALAGREEQVVEANTGAVPLALPPGNNLSRNTVRSALVVLQRAHKIIMAEARLIKSTFPPLLSLPELRDLAVQRPNTAGAVEALTFLTAHLARLLDEVRGLPGVPRLRGPPTAAEAREAAAAAAMAAGHGAAAAAISGFGGGGPRPSGGGALDIESQVSALTKMGVPGAGLPGAASIASIKAARAAAAVRANAIAAAARAAPATPPNRHERLGGRLSPGRTSRPNSARTRGSAPAVPPGLAGEASRLGRGVLLTPEKGGTAQAEAEELKKRLTESVAALAAEGRELQSGQPVAAGEVVEEAEAAEGVPVHGGAAGDQEEEAGAAEGAPLGMAEVAEADGEVAEADGEVAEADGAEELHHQRSTHMEGEGTAPAAAEEPDDEETRPAAEDENGGYGGDGAEVSPGEDGGGVAEAVEEAAAEAEAEEPAAEAEEPAAEAEQPAAEAEEPAAEAEEPEAANEAEGGDEPAVEGEAEGYGYSDEPLMPEPEAEVEPEAGDGEGEDAGGGDDNGFTGEAADGDTPYDGDGGGPGGDAPEDAADGDGDGGDAGGCDDGGGGDPYGEQGGGEEGGDAAYEEQEQGYPGGEEDGGVEGDGQGGGAEEWQEGGEDPVMGDEEYGAEGEQEEY